MCVCVVVCMSATWAQKLIKNASNIAQLTTVHSSNWVIRSHRQDDKKWVLLLQEKKTNWKKQKQNKKTENTVSLLGYYIYFLCDFNSKMKVYHFHTDNFL